MRRFSDQGGHHHTLSELNVTPLLDLAFVLLIIFMITTPLFENSVDLVVPSSQAAKNKVDLSAVQMLSIDQHEKLKLNNRPIDLENLKEQLQNIAKNKPNIAVVIRPDKKLNMQYFMHVMDILHSLGIMKIGIMAHPDEKQ